jgi:glycosyltransferase involved in cell wall biosynthesis
MAPRLDCLDARIWLDLPIDVPLVVYTGHAGPEKGIEALVEMAARLPRAHVVIVGVDPGTSQSQWLEQLAERAGAKNILLRPRVRAADVAPYLYAADCLVIPPTDEPLRRFGRTVLPMKVFTYLAAGRPIVAPRLPDIQEVLTDGVSAVLVPPDVDNAAAELGKLLTDRGRQERLAANALAQSARYTWGARASRIVQFLRLSLDYS